MQIIRTNKTASVVRKLPVTGPYSVTCPTIGCGARPGTPCVDHDRMLGQVRRSKPHAARLVECLPETPKLQSVKRVANNPHSLPRGY